MTLTKSDWESLAPLSGEQVAGELGIDGGTARRMIRKAKEKYGDIFDWYEHEHQTGNELLSSRDRLGELGLLHPPKDGPAILVYDIETAPILAWVWGNWDQNIIDTEQDWYMLSFSYKWLNAKGVGFASIFQDPDFVPDTSNDRYVAERLAALFDAADFTVAHNGDKFDRRKANQRFLFHDIEPPSYARSIDTKKLVQKEFAHASNSLKELGRAHGIGEKVHHTGFELWRECMKGNPKFWKLMEKYNRQDVVLCEKLYVKILPWIGLPGSTRAVNYGFWSKGKIVCPNCGHKELERDGQYRTSVSEFAVYRCTRCRSLTRSRKRTPSAGPEVV